MIHVKECRTADEVRALYREVEARMQARFECRRPRPPKPPPSEPEPTPKPKSKPAPVAETPPPKPPPPLPVGLPSTRPGRIMRMVCEHYGVSVDDMRSTKRTAQIVQARHVAMYLLKRMSDTSLKITGRPFGDKDHTSVLHAVSRIAEQMLESTKFAELVEGMLDELRRQEERQ
jgi:hypothetical protein